MSKPPRPARRPGGATRAVLDALAAQDIPLTQEERERANAFAHDADRRDFIAAHRLVRAPWPPRSSARRPGRSSCGSADTCGGPHGRPTPPDHPGLHVSLSHAKGVVAAACGDRPVGIDLERWNASQPDHSDLISRSPRRSASGSSPWPHPMRTPMPPSRPPRWPSCGSARKECLVKLGRITLDQLDSVDFSAFMQTESVAQAAVTHFAHQGLHYSEWLDPELRVGHGGRRRPFRYPSVPLRLLRGTARRAASPAAEPPDAARLPSQ